MPSARRELGRGASSRAERARDRQALGVGEGSQDVVGGLGHVGGYSYHAGHAADRPAAPNVGAADRHRRAAGRSPPISPSVSATASKRPCASWSPRRRCGSARRSSTTSRGARASSRRKIEGEGPPFEHSAASRPACSLHKAVEVEVGGRDGLDPHDARRRPPSGSSRTSDSREYWRALSAVEQDEILMDAVRRLALFRGTFPPLRELRRELAPIDRVAGAGRAARRRARAVGQARPAPRAAASTAGADARARGSPSTSRPAARTRTTPRTSGSTRCSSRCGSACRRIASPRVPGLAASGRPRTSTRRCSFHAADRVIEAARAAPRCRAGATPALTPGPYCRWCPRALHLPLGRALAGRSGPAARAAR